MNDKLQAEIAKVVADMRPAPNSVGLLTSVDVEEIIKKAATRGVMAGWVAGERTARAHWNRENDKLRERIKDLELDRICNAK